MSEKENKPRVTGGQLARQTERRMMAATIAAGIVTHVEWAGHANRLADIAIEFADAIIKRTES